MARFLVLYRAPISVRAQMESSTPEQRQAGMELWQTWAAKAQSAWPRHGNQMLSQ